MNKWMIMMCLGCICVVCFPGLAHAEIVTTGDIDPATDPATWTSNTIATIGNTGSGTLNITNGSSVSDGAGFIGYWEDSTGEVTVAGTDSTWTNSDDLYISGYGDGTLNILGGGDVSDNDATICYGFGSTGEVTVDGYGSTWTNSGWIRVGHGGSATMNITGGGAVSSGFWTFIGYQLNSVGEVTVDGPDSTLSSYSTIVGYIGDGTLNIVNGGKVSNGFGCLGDFLSGSTGIVTVDGAGSTWTNNDNFRVGNSGRGVLNITGGGLVSVAGTLTIDYDADEDSFINMASGGMMALSGNAADSLASFLNMIDGTDAIRYWDYSLGNWVNITSATLNEDFTLMYLTEGGLAGYTMLKVLEQALLEGDADYDGVVSAGDYSSVQGNFGSVGIPGIPGDANGDGVVSAGDYSSVQANFGNVAPPLTAVPEPASLSLVALTGILLLRKRRKSN